MYRYKQRKGDYASCKLFFPIRQNSLDKNKCSHYNTNTDRKRETEYRNPCPDRPVRNSAMAIFYCRWVVYLRLVHGRHEMFETTLWDNYTHLRFAFRDVPWTGLFFSLSASKCNSNKGGFCYERIDRQKL